MGFTRRTFLKMSAGTMAATAFSGLGISLSQAKEKAGIAKFENTKVTSTICCYCAVGCGALVHTRLEDKVAVNIEGDPDHPINEGALCAKGAALRQLHANKARPPKPLHRKPNSTEWQEMEWEDAIKRIAQLIKETRDKTFTVKNEKGQLVNRAESMVSLGSAALDNEECWTLQAMQRAIGLVNIEHQARI